MIGRALSRKGLSGGQHLVDPNDIPWSLLPAGFLDGAMSTLDRAVGIPALLGVLMRVSQGCGMMPRKVYEPVDDGRQPALGERIYELLHDRPSAEATPFSFNADVGGSVAASGKALIRKVKSVSGAGVLELLVEDALAWKTRRLGGRLVFDKISDRGQSLPQSLDDFVFVRGMALRGEVEPLSPIAAHRVGISVALQRQRFELSHYANGAQPGTVLAFPETMTQEQAEEWVDMWDERHQGVGQAFRTSAIGGGATVTTLPVSMVDAQFVESTSMTAQQIGAIYAMPKAFLNIGHAAPTDADWRFWVTFGLGWITTAIDQAFNADRDLFPRGSGLFSETVTDALLKPDIRTRYEAFKAARQAGWLTANEIRKIENYPPHEDGDVIQVIPVGGGGADGSGGGDGAGDSDLDLDSLGLTAQRFGLAIRNGVLSQEEARRIFQQIFGVDLDAAAPSLNGNGVAA